VGTEWVDDWRGRDIRSLEKWRRFDASGFFL
jgi:hypothetical protein